LAAECLAKEDSLPVAVSTLRRWLSQGGLWERRRKRRPHRRRRPRREHRGELLQLDGSYHDWFEARRGWAVLMVMIDDATGAVHARFYEQESWSSAVDVFQRYVLRHGLPRSLYVDRHGIYRPDEEPTAEQLLAKKQPETQFGRAMRELDVELILARSPQAKGRVERVNGTLQDRLVKALRRAGIATLDRANEFLEKSFLAEFNQRFAVAPTQTADGHRPLPRTTDLARILSIQEQRVVQNDWTVRWHNRPLQLPRESAEFVRPRQRVTICEQLDGVLRIFAGDRELTWSDARCTPPPRKRRKARSGPTGSSQGHKPRPDHPWRGRGARGKTADESTTTPVGVAPKMGCSAPAR
jgi:hypothetical protein